MPEIEYVRAKDPGSGHEYTTSREVAESTGVQILDKPAVDANGRPLTAKPNVGARPGSAKNKAAATAKADGLVAETPERKS